MKADSFSKTWTVRFFLFYSFSGLYLWTPSEMTWLWRSDRPVPNAGISFFDLTSIWFSNSWSFLLSGHWAWRIHCLMIPRLWILLNDLRRERRKTHELLFVWDLRELAVGSNSIQSADSQRQFPLRVPRLQISERLAHMSLGIASREICLSSYPSFSWQPKHCLISLWLAWAEKDDCSKLETPSGPLI